MFIIGRFLKSLKDKIELNKQIKLLKKYNISNYVIENGRIVVNEGVDLRYLKECDKDLLNNVTINGYLDLTSLKICYGGFIKNTIINGNLRLDSLRYLDGFYLENTIINGDLYLSFLGDYSKNSLKNTIINGYLFLIYVTKFKKKFLKNTVVNGGLVLSSLKQYERDILNSNVKKLKEGFNKDFNVLYIDSKISRGYSYYEKDNWVVYKTNDGTIHQRNIIKDNRIISKFY